MKFRICIYVGETLLSQNYQFTLLSSEFIREDRQVNLSAYARGRLKLTQQHVSVISCVLWSRSRILLFVYNDGDRQLS